MQQCFWSFSLTHSCFFSCQRRQRQSKEKNWEINDFFDVNGVNGKYAEKNLSGFFDVNGVNGIYTEKNFGDFLIFNVNGVNGSIRGQTISAFEVFLWLIHVFSNVNGVNGKLE